MAPISLDSAIRFYVPPQQARKPGPVASKISPATSVAAATATVAASADGQGAESAESRQRDESVPTIDVDMGLTQTEMNAHPSDGPTACVRALERAQSGDGINGSWFHINDIISPSDSDNNDGDGFPTVEELLFSNGNGTALAPGSRDKPTVIGGVEDRDLEYVEPDAGGSSVRTDRNVPCTPPTTVASSDASAPSTPARENVTGCGRRSSSVEAIKEADQDSATDATDITAGGTNEKDNANVGSGFYSEGDDDRGLASTSGTAKKQMLPPATGGLSKSNSAPQHRGNRHRRYRHYRFSAPEPSDEEGAMEFSGRNKSHPSKRPFESSSSRQQRRPKQRRMRFSQVLHSSSKEMGRESTSGSEFELAPPVEPSR